MFACCVGTRFLIHCQAGRTRSPCICILYAMFYHHCALRDAFAYVYISRFIGAKSIVPNDAYRSMLLLCDQRLFPNGGALSLEDFDRICTGEFHNRFQVITTVWVLYECSHRKMNFFL